MNFLKCAVALSVCVAFAGAVVAGEPDTTAHDLAAQCAAKNGTFDPATSECTEPSADSAAGDLVVGPMLKVVPETHDGDASESAQ
jgi:hypothetical protein